MEKGFSLSYLFDEMKRREVETKGRKSGFSATAGLTILKVLRGSHPEAMVLTALARAAQLKLGPCQEILDHLQEEGLVQIEPDPAEGNDRVRLTEKGLDLL